LTSGSFGGEVAVLGTDPAGAGPFWRARIGVVLQESGPERDLTVAECLHLYAARSHLTGFAPVLLSA
jgi:ABC-2 type transport system ATP-binding protein